MSASEIKLRCAAKNTSPGTEYTWYKDGRELTLQEFPRYKVKKFKYLKISDLSKGDSGKYTCSVSNQFGSDNATTVVTVNGEMLIKTWGLCYRAG